MIWSILIIYCYRDNKVYFILYGTLTLHSAQKGKISTITEDNTIGEECIFDKKYVKRQETVYVESDKAGVLELTTSAFMILKEIMYECGHKKDFLMLETILRRNFILKKNMRNIWVFVDALYL